MQVTAAMCEVCPALTIGSAADMADVAEHHKVAPHAPRPCYALIILTDTSRAKFGPNFDFYLKYGVS